MTDEMSKLGGAEIAELATRVLMKSLCDDISYLVVDSLIFLAQDGGTDLKTLVRFLALPKKVVERTVTDLEAKGLIKGEQPPEAEKGYTPKYKNPYRYFIDYLWVFHHLEWRYCSVMKTIEKTSDEPLEEFRCDRCGKKFVGTFSVFQLRQREGSNQLHCNSCNGTVNSYVIKKNKDRADHRAAVYSQLSIIKKILELKPSLYIPADTERIRTSGDIKSATQYATFKEQAAASKFQSSVWQIEDDGRTRVLQNDMKVMLMGISAEERERGKIEGKKRARATCHNIPWLKDDLASKTGEASQDTQQSGKAATQSSLGYLSLNTHYTAPHSFTPSAYVYYLKSEDKCNNLKRRKRDDDFMTVSQYLSSKELTEQQESV